NHPLCYSAPTAVMDADERFSVLLTTDDYLQSACVIEPQVSRAREFFARPSLGSGPPALKRVALSARQAF
ncbi:MAG: hypothetical protein ACE5EF_11170, partial [Dehalococcoidia bacterium]